MSACDGRWLPELDAADGDHAGITVLRCSDCRDRLVIIGGRGYDVNDATSAEDAGRRAMMQRMEERRALAG